MKGRVDPAPRLAVANLRKRFGKVEALRGVSFALEPGEIFGYLGPNGAGKTTTLRAILGLVRPDAGAVEILGRPAPLAPSRAEVGYLPGELKLDPRLTGRATLDYFAGFRPSRPPVLRGRVLEALDLRPGDLSRRVKELSHGTKQKIGLAVAMQQDPVLLLLDEPTSGLDPLVQKSFRDLLSELVRAGRTVFFSSHVLSEVESVCRRVAILRAGEIVATETIEALRARVTRRLEARFSGEAPADLAGIPGVARAEIKGREALLWVRGDVNPVLRRIARERVERFVFPEPELEDIFVTYYRGDARPGEDAGV